MKLTVLVPPVSECEATRCTYNIERRCHAKAITVGDGIHPACDTFMPSSEHCRDVGAQAGVGACKVSACAHNRDFECQAESIRVGFHGDHPDCTTFAARP